MTDFNSASGAVRQDLPPISCHACHDRLGAEWVYVSARNLAGRLYSLDLCGVCWAFLRGVVEAEVRAPEPGTQTQERLAAWRRLRDAKGRFRPGP